LIETGLFQFATTNAAIVALSAPGPNPQTPAGAFWFSKLPKTPLLPAAVLHRVSSVNADETLDLPGTQFQQIWGRFQLESMAQDDPSAKGAVSASGYLAAAALSRAYRLQLMGLVNSLLPDGTKITDCRIQDEFDSNFEEGALGYVYRRILDFKLEYLEQS
jgi:hypothetical protein